MRTTSRGRILALGGAVLLLAVITAGCARRSSPASLATTAPIASAAAEATTPDPSVGATPADADADATPPGTAAPTAAAAPISSPDLSSIDGLIKDIDNELGADASAGTDEGTTP